MGGSFQRESGHAEKTAISSAHDLIGCMTQSRKARKQVRLSVYLYEMHSVLVTALERISCDSVTGAGVAHMEYALHRELVSFSARIGYASNYNSAYHWN